MKFSEIILGIIFIFVGVNLIVFYNNLIKNKKQGGLSYKLRIAGFGLIMIGVSLIIRFFSRMWFF